MNSARTCRVRFSIVSAAGHASGRCSVLVVAESNAVAIAEGRARVSRSGILRGQERLLLTGTTWLPAGGSRVGACYACQVWPVLVAGLSPAVSQWVLAGILIFVLAFGWVPLWALEKIWAWQERWRRQAEERRTRCLICHRPWAGRRCRRCGFERERERGTSALRLTNGEDVS